MDVLIIRWILLRLILLVAPSFSAAQESILVCLTKTHPVKGCAYDWDVADGKCKFTCKASAPPPPMSSVPSTKPPMWPTTTPVGPGSNEDQGDVWKRAYSVKLSPEERTQLDAYRLVVNDAKAKGTIKASDLTIMSERSELTMYKSVLPKAVKGAQTPAKLSGGLTK
jgi:hypothetical protein